jgi:peptide/nickel transport system substrate-binding protein
MSTPTSRSRRRAARGVGLVAVLAAGVLALSACSSKSPTSTGSAAPAPTDKTLKLSFLQDPGQPPDPDIYYAGQGLLLTTNIYEGLLAYKPVQAKPEFVPALAESWTVSPDKKTYTFKLRQGVTFHDGTPFTSAAIKASIDRRLAVNQGPAYMVTDVASVTTQGDYAATIVLKDSNSVFLDFLASAYGPKMLSPTGLKANAGKDNAQTYLQTHDLGTGPYTLTAAAVGSKYALKAYDKYWGTQPYFTTVEIPVITDSSSQQLQFDKGELAAILHDLPTTAVASYLKNDAISAYSLPTLMSDYMYVNPNTPFGKVEANRKALLQAVDRNAIFTQAYVGRGKLAEAAYPANMVGAGEAAQNVTFDATALKGLTASMPADQKSITVGYDTSSPDNQLVANLMAAQLTQDGLTVKVQGFATSQIFGWVGDVKGAPDILATLGWPDAAAPYTWGHISWDPGAGLNYLHCSDPSVTKSLASGLVTGATKDYSDAGTGAIATGCWFNLVDQDDFVVAQKWLKGVETAHVVTQPNTLSLASLSA